MLSDLNSFYIFLFTSCRMAGVIFFNPIFGRRNIPTMVKIGLALGISLNASYGMLDLQVADYTIIDMLLTITKELAVGLALGFAVQLFLSIFHIGGELIDLQMGVSMAQMYDPTSNSQISISGNLLTIMYTLLFFITNSHINLLAIAIKSFLVVPIGVGGMSGKIGVYFVELFGYILVYSLQLALPVVVTEILVEMAVGILMRVVPNINVFVVNLQLKLIVGMIVIITIIPVLVHFMGKLNMIMLERLEKVLLYFM
ncbi:flagellar biosynthetic protein FliR [Anoxybacterium hadale]|uniref:Flagellar biosynthetic protein FliR n=1 Tax=Anoxybacterium hadale TaxID=3408580 RepID=A0ACD1ABQ8_9FIRM|nr:flagellar biosynthetic protein FliR [Clostridiales bacterium]